MNFETMKRANSNLKFTKEFYDKYWAEFTNIYTGKFPLQMFDYLFITSTIDEWLAEKSYQEPMKEKIYKPKTPKMKIESDGQTSDTDSIGY